MGACSDHIWTCSDIFRYIQTYSDNIFAHIRPYVDHIWTYLDHIQTHSHHTPTYFSRSWPVMDNGRRAAAGGRAAGEWSSHLFCASMKTKKTRTARTIILPAVSRRDLCYVSENDRFRFFVICPKPIYRFEQQLPVYRFIGLGMRGQSDKIR